MGNNADMRLIGKHLSAKDITSLVKSSCDLGTILESIQILRILGEKHEILVWAARRN